MKKVNIAIGIIFILFSAFIFIQANSFTQTLIVDTGLGADFFPKVISCGIVLLSGTLIFSSIKNKSLSDKVEEVFNSDMKKPLIGMALVVAYGICMTLIGYLVSTVVFCFIFLTMFKVKKMLTKILVSVIFSFVIYFIFSNLFLINLPQGFLI
jgi:putative tricarboxylic transport membrane protein